jgi:hypothetical protein
MTETTTEPKYGQAAIEERHGFSPLPDPQAPTSPDTFEGNQSGIAAATEELKPASRQWSMYLLPGDVWWQSLERP